jgi:hypothetical protein
VLPPANNAGSNNHLFVYDGIALAACGRVTAGGRPTATRDSGRPIVRSERFQVAPGRQLGRARADRRRAG